MKQIKHRRRKLRIGNPVGFSLFCLGCLAVLALLYVGIAWLVRHGSTVAQAVKDAVTGPVTPACPGSILQLHPDCTLVADEEALSLL